MADARMVADTDAVIDDDDAEHCGDRNFNAEFMSMSVFDGVGDEFTQDREENSLFGVCENGIDWAGKNDVVLQISNGAEPRDKVEYF